MKNKNRLLIILLIATLIITICTGCRKRIIEGIPDNNITSEPKTTVQEIWEIEITQEITTEKIEKTELKETTTAEYTTQEITTKEIKPQSNPVTTEEIITTVEITTSTEPIISIVMLSEQIESEPEHDWEITTNTTNTESPEIIIVVEALEKESENSVTETKEADNVNDEEAKPSDKGGAVGIIIDLYTNFLSERQGELYECQKGYVYFETAEDYRTVNRTAYEHNLILESGGYNIAEKLRDDALTVAADWVVRKNPTIIVRCVDSDVLGDGITDISAAMAVRDSIFSRLGWDGINAVIERKVLLLSSQLFSTDEGRLIAKLYIARAMYPKLFSETDITAFYQEIKDVGGVDFTNGIYVY